MQVDSRGSHGFAPSLASEADPDSTLAARLQSCYLDLELRDGSRAVHDMRRSKDDDEVLAIEAAIGVTAKALDHAVRAVRSGAREHEIEAEIAHVYRAHGATHAFAPIVGCGPNALKLHYQENTATLSPGALLLVDTGASLAGYKADITRTLPVDGRFTPRQREVYDAVLAAQQAAIEACRPGALLGDVHACAWESLERSGLARWFLHGTSHHLGLETHDVGDLHAPLDPGAVVTIEPGVYLPDEALGIRIEDDVLVTSGGPRVLSASIPREAAAIEAWMQGGSR